MMSGPVEAKPSDLNSPTATQPATMAGVAGASGGAAAPVGGIRTAESDEAALREEELDREQLAECEREIETLRAVLHSKQEKAYNLRRKLGISPLGEFRADLDQQLKSIQDTQAYQKASDVIKGAGEKTTQIFGNITRKLGEMKNSPTYRSIEERMGSAYTNVRSSISSRSASLYSFNGDALSVPQTPAQDDRSIVIGEEVNGSK